MAPPRKRGGRGWCLSALVLTGCASAVRLEPRSPVFYPALPNPPHIQHLASFSSEADLGARGRFAEFVAGATPRETGVIRKPYGVALWRGKLLVVDTRGPGYLNFDLQKRRARVVSGDGPGRMRKPINIAVDADGIRYVTDTGRNQVLVFDAQDRFLRAYGREDQFKPADALVLGDRLYVADLQHGEIQVLEGRSGKLLFKFGKPGSNDGELVFPTNLAAGPDGHIYVTDTGNFRIQVFTAEGKFVRSYGGLGSDLGQFVRPKGVALDREGRMYVVDAAFENVQVFDREGRLLLFFGGPGDRPESINLPTAVAVDYDNVAFFQRYADPGFRLEYVVLVASQFGVNKVNVFGFGRMQGIDYPDAERPVAGQP